MNISRSIHAAANGIISFFFMAVQYSIVYMYHIFIHSSVDGHFVGLHVLAIMNSAAVNIGMHYLFEFWFSSGRCPGVGLLDHTIVPFLVFKGTSILFFVVAAPVYIPTNSVRRFLFLHTLSSIYYLEAFLMMAILTGAK